MFTRMGAVAAILVVLCVSLHTTIALQEVVLNSTLYFGEYARPGQRVTFTCEARDASILEWYSDEYIGTGGDRIEILRNGDGSDQTRHGGETVATTVSVNTYSGVTVIISQLHIMTSEQIPTSSVMCAINGAGPRKAISFATTAVSLQNLILNHTLFLGEYARPRQRVTFTCEARDASILEWYSDEYIGTGGDRIEILRNGDGSDQTRRGGETVATTVSVNTYSGVTVIISQLHIMTSEQIPTSSVLCAINGAGPRKTISFATTAVSLQNVILNHTLFLGNYARPGQRVTFTCEARDASILEWYSDEYIGTGGDRIEILRNGDGSNQTRLGGETVATTVSVNTYSGVTVIISQLYIMTSEQIPTSSVMCAINGAGPRKTISFATTDIHLNTDSIPEITSTSEPIITTPDNQFRTTAERDRNNSNIAVIAAIVGLCGGGIIIAVSLGLVVIIMYARIKSKRKSRVGSNEMLQEEQPDDVTDKKPPATPVKETNEEPHDVEPLEKSEKKPLLEMPICVGTGNARIVVRGRERSNTWKQPVGLAHSTSLLNFDTYTKDEDASIVSISLPQLNVDGSTSRFPQCNSKQHADIESGSDIHDPEPPEKKANEKPDEVEPKSEKNPLLDLDIKKQDVTHDEGHSGTAFEDSGVDDESSNGSECDMESQAIKKREQVDEGHGEDSGVDNDSSNGSECEMESKLKKYEQVGEVPKPKVKTETAQNPDSNEKPNRDGGVTEPEDDVDGEVNVQPTLCTYESPHEDLVSFKRRETDYRKLADIINELHKRIKKMRSELRSGEFGTVSKGMQESPMGGMDVAVKQLQPGAPEEEKVKILQEAAINGQLKHPDIVKLVTTGESTMIVPQLHSKVDLHVAFLKQWQPDESQNLSVDKQEHPKLYHRIVSALEYPSFKKGFVYRDLAPGNVLVSRDHMSKISDFGMSRVLMDESYYNSGRKIPVNWTAPEPIVAPCTFYGQVHDNSDFMFMRRSPTPITGFGLAQQKQRKLSNMHSVMQSLMSYWRFVSLEVFQNDDMLTGYEDILGYSYYSDMQALTKKGKKGSRGEDGVNRRLGPLGSPGKQRESKSKGNAEPFGKSGHPRKTGRPGKKGSRGKDGVNRRLGPLGSPGKWREPGSKGNAEPFGKSGHFRKTGRPEHQT